MPEFSRRGAAGAAPAGTPLACRRISAHSHHRGRSPGSVCPSAPGRSACPAAPTGTAPWKDPEQGPCSTALVKHGAHQDLSSGETGAAAETGGARGEYQSSSGLVERGTGAASGDGRPIGREPPGAQGLFTAWDRPPSQSMRPVCSARDRSEPGRTVRPIHSPMDQPATKDYPSVEPPVNNPLRTKWFPVEFLPWNHAEPKRARTRGRPREPSDAGPGRGRITPSAPPSSHHRASGPLRRPSPPCTRRTHTGRRSTHRSRTRCADPRSPCGPHHPQEEARIPRSGSRHHPRPRRSPISTPPCARPATRHRSRGWARALVPTHPFLGSTPVEARRAQQNGTAPSTMQQTVSTTKSVMTRSPHVKQRQNPSGPGSQGPCRGAAFLPHPQQSQKPRGLCKASFHETHSQGLNHDHSSWSKHPPWVLRTSLHDPTDQAYL